MPNPDLLILGIETSCDETSVAIVKNGKEILGVSTYSQIKEHATFDGVVPEIASRNHLEKINPLVDETFHQAQCRYQNLDAIAVTDKPGLIGSLLMGVMTAKTFAYCWNLPLIAVNHIEAHCYSVFLEHDIEYPVISLVVSGGHTMLLVSESPLEHRMLGTTIDDAVGEAYDKIAKFLNLGYPGGPAVDRMAALGNAEAYPFPEVHFKKEDYAYHFSFSGLKTSFIYLVRRLEKENVEINPPDLCASFQKAAVDALFQKCLRLSKDTDIPRVVVVGGVAQNSYVKHRFLNEPSFQCWIPSPSLCGDNAAMIAGLGYHHYKHQRFADERLNPSSRIIQKNSRGDVWLVND